MKLTSQRSPQHNETNSTKKSTAARSLSWSRKPLKVLIHYKQWLVGRGEGRTFYCQWTELMKFSMSLMSLASYIRLASPVSGHDISSGCSHIYFLLCQTDKIVAHRKTCKTSINVDIYKYLYVNRDDVEACDTVVAQCDLGCSGGSKRTPR